ncbi:hypothetical protein AB0X56_04370 [Weissella paramesenteroides]|uniref:hypothetical protein n=1 Tax=Weissella paramesenteroides TaxID=1249 RepID=UPI003F238FED
MEHENGSYGIEKIEITTTTGNRQSEREEQWFSTEAERDKRFQELTDAARKNEEAATTEPDIKIIYTKI